MSPVSASRPRRDHAFALQKKDVNTTRMLELGEILKGRDQSHNGNQNANGVDWFSDGRSQYVYSLDSEFYCILSTKSSPPTLAPADLRSIAVQIRHRSTKPSLPQPVVSRRPLGPSRGAWRIGYRLSKVQG